MKTQEQEKDNSAAKVEARKTVDVELSEKELGAVAGGRDPASGLPTGQRMHQPLTITSE